MGQHITIHATGWTFGMFPWFSFEFRKLASKNTNPLYEDVET
ncbi:hypothetical protein [Bartonella gliris]|nr:hypothetical protein [Bartonella gliris]